VWPLIPRYQHCAHRICNGAVLIITPGAPATELPPMACPTNGGRAGNVISCPADAEAIAAEFSQSMVDSRLPAAASGCSPATLAMPAPRWMGRTAMAISATAELSTPTKSGGSWRNVHYTAPTRVPAGSIATTEMPSPSGSRS
jgi:hypothetical protein